MRNAVNGLAFFECAPSADLNWARFAEFTDGRFGLLFPIQSPTYLPDTERPADRHNFGSRCRLGEAACCSGATLAAPAPVAAGQLGHPIHCESVNHYLGLRSLGEPR